MRLAIMLVSGICLVLLGDGTAIWKLTGHTIENLPLVTALMWIFLIIFLASGFMKRTKNEQRR